MKQLSFIAILFATLVCFSCNETKPSSRENVYADDTLSVEVKGDQILVPYTRNGGELAEIQVSLNGVPFNVLWDTGCSMTSISNLEFLKMVKEGKITDDDYVGAINVTIGDGSSTQEKVYVIRELFIPGQDSEHYLRIQDVHVAVAENLAAPLLLGQNVMQNLPKHSFNENKEVIEFEK